MRWPSSLIPPNKTTNDDDTPKSCDIEFGDLLPKSLIICKPFENAFQQAFKMANVGSSKYNKGMYYALESIHNIIEALPEIWESVMKSKDVRDSQKIAIETPVKA
ncbi:hypothetical protein L6452_19611 [Arctium lappa]|uniref:Uncharacterized protein n=1 Tax=Arctium lappa TaxID=4217 RepID=A0ACB9B8N0_ARCLA|nr:hypothetical protein L6452_19611 [Arctium lappa]